MSVFHASTHRSNSRLLKYSLLKSAVHIQTFMTRTDLKTESYGNIVSTTSVPTDSRHKSSNKPDLLVFKASTVATFEKRLLLIASDVCYSEFQPTRNSEGRLVTGLEQLEDVYLFLPHTQKSRVRKPEIFRGTAYLVAPRRPSWIRFCLPSEISVHSSPRADPLPL